MKIYLSSFISVFYPIPIRILTLVIVWQTEVQPTRSYPVSIRQMEPEIKHLQISIFISIRFLYDFYKSLAAGDCLRDGSVHSTRSYPVYIRQIKPEIKYLLTPSFISIHFLSEYYKGLVTDGYCFRRKCTFYPIISGFYPTNGTRVGFKYLFSQIQIG